MMPHFVIKDERINDVFYSLSGRKLFLYRAANNGFVNKWCGIWKPPFKFYEYFAFRINGEWLSPQNVTSLKYAYYFAAHRYELKSSGNADLNVTEILFIPKDKSALVTLLRLENLSGEEKEVEVMLEAAVNIRRKQEEFNLRQYESTVEQKRKCVLVKSEDDLYACFGTDFAEEALEIDHNIINFYKEHYPSGEFQKCFIPVNYFVRMILAPGEVYYLPFAFSAGFTKKEAIDSFDESIAKWRDLLKEKVKHTLNLLEKNVFLTNDESLNTLFKISILNIDSFIYEQNDENVYLVSGLPWFIEAWGRDNMFSVLSLLTLGMEKEAERVLQFFARHTKNRVPCVVVPEKHKIDVSYHGADVSPLFLLVADEYEKTCGKPLPEVSRVEKKVMAGLELEDDLVFHKGNETWMDTLIRGPTAVEIQGLWMIALKKRDKKLYERVRARFVRPFWNNDFMYPFDSFGRVVDASVTPNCLIPALFGVYERHELKAIIRKMKEVLESDFGIRTLSKVDVKYQPDSYHRGSVWGFTTLLGAAACFRSGDYHHGIILMRKLLHDVNRDHIGFVGETWNAESSQLIGASAQLWSTSLIPFIIDRYLIGLDVDNNHITFRITFPPGVRFIRRKNARIAGVGVDLVAVKLKNTYWVELSFSSLPPLKCRLVVPENVKIISVNDKVYEGNVALFKPRKKNVIKCFLKC